LRPIIENARAKVQEVAKAQGFDYVIDASLGGALLMAEGKDLSSDVKKALGI
jgi:outer membrane protein